MRKFTKVPVLAFAQARKDFADAVEEHARPIMFHIILLMMFPASSARNHWRSEIADQLFKVPLLKGKRLPDADLIYDNTYVADRFRIPKLIRIAAKKRVGSEAIIEVSIEDAEDKCSKYFRWLAAELSREGDLDEDEIYDKLDDLCLFGNSKV